MFLRINFSKSMLKSVNQSMVNRYIAGGGNCKCVRCNGISGESNGNGINGGKIEAEFAMYVVDDKLYVKQEDAAKVFNAILDMDPEKYEFYRMTYTTEIDGIATAAFSGCNGHYDKDNDGGSFFGMSPANNDSFDISFSIKNNTIDYANAQLFGADIDDSKIANTSPEGYYKLTLYYTER